MKNRIITTVLMLLMATTLSLGGSFTPKGSIVLDNDTALIWQNTAAPNAMSWENSILYCEALLLEGESDWRLANKKELESLVDFSRSNPSIDTVFENTYSQQYWSSTTRANNSTSAWVVGFSVGYTRGEPKIQEYRVRCVRGGTL